MAKQISKSHFFVLASCLEPMSCFRNSELKTTRYKHQPFEFLMQIFCLMLSVMGLTGLASASAFAGDEEGKVIATKVCSACHAEDGNSLVPMFPKLAGQQVNYIEKQLKEFISGKRKNDVMAPVVAALKSDDAPALALYYASQKSAPGAVQDASLAVIGKKMYVDGNEESGVPACAGCHQDKGEGDARFPRLAGQHQEYLVSQMKSFASGERSNDQGRSMRSVAKRMTEQEMKSVAEYIAGL